MRGLTPITENVKMRGLTPITLIWKSCTMIIRRLTINPFVHMEGSLFVRERVIASYPNHTIRPHDITARSEVSTLGLSIVYRYLHYLI